MSMSFVSVNFETLNDAFEDGNANNEISRIFGELAEKFKDGSVGDEHIIRDCNGNVIGILTQAN